MTGTETCPGSDRWIVSGDPEQSYGWCVWCGEFFNRQGDGVSGLPIPLDIRAGGWVRLPEHLREVGAERWWEPLFS